MYRIEERSQDALLGRHAAFGAALSWIGRTGGVVAADETGFERFLPWLQIMVPAPGGSPYLWCGAKSPPAELWGLELANSLIGERAVPDREFDRAVGADYLRVARGGKAIIQAVRCPIEVRGTVIPLFYHRLVFPVRFRGFEAVGSLAIFDVHRLQSLG